MTNLDTSAEPADKFASFRPYFLAEEGRVEITLPNGEPMYYDGSPVAIIVHGPSTDEWAHAHNLREKAATQRVFAVVNVAKKGNQAKTANPGSTSDIDAQFLATLTKRIENFPYPGGIAPMYADARLAYLHAQVSAYVSSLGNFFPASAQN